MTEREGLPAKADRIESALSIAAAVTSVVPWLGGPVAAVLSGAAMNRRFDRVSEFMQEVAADVSGLQFVASREYVLTEDFEELLEETLQRVARERLREKRVVYRRFLADAIRHPGEYHDQLELVRAIETLQAEHLRVLAAIAQEAPQESRLSMGTPLDTLQRRLGRVEIDVGEAVERLNDLRVTNLQSLRTTMTGRGAEDLRHAVTPFGQRLLRLLSEGDKS